MKDLPLALQQLILTTAAELGLGDADKPALEIQMRRVYNLGLKHALEKLDGRDRKDDGGS